MPLREDLLEPIPGDSPSGENLRYAPVYDQIKEARRQEEDLSQGIWERRVKKADYALVVKLTGEALAKKSKDLQLAAWLTEALLWEEGITGLRQGLDLMRSLLESFWDSLHPELEDGYADMRAGILDWVGSRLDEPVKRSPLTRNGLDWFQYKESRTIGYEEECAGDDTKLEARAAAVAEGKPTAEEFDSALNATPKSYYVELMADVENTLASLRALEDLTDSKLTDEPPSFSGLRASLEEFQQTVGVLLARKRDQEPTEQPAAQALPEPEVTAGEPVPEAPAVAEAAAVPAPAPARETISLEPADREDAVRRVIAVARYLRQEDSYSPVPYLMLRGLRWGELRAGGDSIDAGLLEPPPTDMRQQLKRHALDGEWQEVLETGETAMGMPCGRGWLDLQRYAVRACNELGSWYDPIANSIRAELKALLADFPALPEMTLMDDTPTANNETQSWLRELLGPPQTETPEAAVPMDDSAPEEGASELEIDTYELAMRALRSGKPEEAINLLTQEIAWVKTGRERFRRRMQLAQVCLGSGRELIAYPILRDLAAEIERRRLEEWEAADTLAHPLVLLYRCMMKLDRAPEEKQDIYERICRLDPVQAMACSE